MSSLAEPIRHIFLPFSDSDISPLGFCGLRQPDMSYSAGSYHSIRAAKRRSNVVADSYPFALDASSETLWLLCTLILLSFLSNNLAQGGILLHHIGSSCYLLSLYGGRRLVLTACLFRLLASMLNGNERYRKLKLSGTIKSDNLQGIVSYYSQFGNERWWRRCFRREGGPVMASNGSIRAGGKCY